MKNRMIIGACLILTLSLQRIFAPDNQLSGQKTEKKSWWKSTTSKIIFGLSAIGAAAVIVAGGAQYKRKQALNADLFLAVFDGNVQAATELLDKGADPNYYEKDGIRLLYTAVENNDTPMVKTLLHHKADPDVSGVRVAPLAIAVEHDNRDAIRALVKANARIEGVKMRNGKMVKDYAEENANVEVLQIFGIDSPKASTKK